MNIIYFLDRNTLEIIDILQVEDFEINIDEETNAKSTIKIMKKVNICKDDIIVLKSKANIEYIGVISEISNQNGENLYTIIAKYITNMFDRKVILKNQTLIASTGLEDFIKRTIEDNFSKSSDSLLNKNYIEVTVSTHTKYNFSVDTDNGIYNFHTFITNCTQNYDINYDFLIVDGKLKINIYKQNLDEYTLIDTNISDVTNYSETIQNTIISKVIVLDGNRIEHNFYLLNDRTISTNANDTNRALGDTEIIYEEKDENIQQVATDKFKSNSYSHLIEFGININSKLFDIRNWKIGKVAKIKNKSNKVIDTYISAITKKKDSNIWSIKTGNIRITLLDKLKQGG